MNLKNDLAKTHSKYESDLNLILDFVNTTEKSLTRKQKRKPKVQFQEKDREELKKLITFLNEATDDELKGQRSISIKSDALGKLINNMIVPIKHRDFLTEMTLSYLISYQEAMLKEYLYGVLFFRKDPLKSNNKITYNEIIGFKSIKALISYLAQKEVDQLGYGSIDDMANYFKEKFNIDFTIFDKWENIVEASFRRNLFIHNNGISNDKYCKRTGYKTKGQRLKIDVEYIVSVAKNLISFNDFCYESLKSKFKVA